jgi:hypothetical protein
MNSWHELRPGSDVVANLKFLREQALAGAREWRGKDNAMGLVGVDALAETAQKFVVRVNEKENLLGLPRVTRILRHRAGFVWGLSPSAGPDPEATINWLDQVVENIESELSVIDRERVMWLTVASAALAALAVLVGVAAIGVSIFMRLP